MRTEDGCIIQECLNGESEAFGVLVDKYKAGIYAFACAKLGDFRDAQDVTQEVFVQAYRDLRSLRRWESFAFWLYRIAYTHCAQLIRARSKRVDGEFIQDQDPGIFDLPSLDSYRQSQVDESVRDALDALPKIYREALMLRYFGGMNSSEIAKALGTSPTAVRKRLSRARAQLREEMVDMMDTAFQGQRLQASFTFRVVDAIRRIKIHPTPRTTGLPWGLSLAAGIIIAFLSLNPRMSITSDMAIPTGSSLPVETKVLKTGEIPVDIMKTSEISVISSKQGDGDGGEPQFQIPNSSFMLAPSAGGDTWTKKADMPTPRWHISAVVVNGRIYVIGGCDAKHDFSTVEEYDPAEDMWVAKSDMPTARLLLNSASVVDGKIYAIGGANDKVLSTVEEYDPTTDTWTKKADMPTARYYLSTCAVNGKIYAIGGISGNNDDIFHSTTEEYDPETDTWTTKADMPTARAGLGTAVVNGKIYAIGGIMGQWGGGGTVLSAVEEYDPMSDVWVKKTDMPTATNSFGTCTVNGKIYAIGGSTNKIAGQGWTLLSTLYEYNPATDKWEKKDDMSTARCALAATAVNGRIYAIGGSPTYNIGEPLSTVEEFDTGFAVEPIYKLPTKWGEVKSD